MYLYLVVTHSSGSQTWLCIRIVGLVLIVYTDSWEIYHPSYSGDLDWGPEIYICKFQVFLVLYHI